MVCKVCGNTSEKIFNTLVLNKYYIDYFKCNTCNFIQTDDPFWLSEAYSSAIGILDIGLLYRNHELSNSISDILNQFSDVMDSYLDYGGGYGVFVRMMRDKGYDFYIYDKYCENLFAKYFEITDYKGKKFTTLTAFEVFEHLVDPVSEIGEMWKYSDVIIFSTELQPDKPLNSDKDWWYFVPYGGQHIAFYHFKTLQKLSEIFNCKLFSNGTTTHILSKRDINDPFLIQKNDISRVTRILTKIQRIITKEKPTSRSSLLMQDWEYYKKKLGV